MVYFSAYCCESNKYSMSYWAMDRPPLIWLYHGLMTLFRLLTIRCDDSWGEVVRRFWGNLRQLCKDGVKEWKWEKKQEGKERDSSQMMWENSCQTEQPWKKQKQKVSSGKRESNKDATWEEKEKDLKKKVMEVDILCNLEKADALRAVCVSWGNVSRGKAFALSTLKFFAKVQALLLLLLQVCYWAHSQQ